MEKNKKQVEENLKEEQMDSTQPDASSAESVEQNTSAESNENEGSEKSQVDPVEEANQKYLRLYAEFDNFRRRTTREKSDLIKSAGADILESLLPVLDDLDRALKNIDDKETKKGIELLQSKMYNILESKGLQAFECKGEVFDADLHEAVTTIPAPDKKLKGKIVDEIEKGYKLGDKVLRFAKVVVGE